MSIYVTHELLKKAQVGKQNGVIRGAPKTRISSKERKRTKTILNDFGIPVIFSIFFNLHAVGK